MEMKCHDVLEQKLCKELELLHTKYTQNPNQQMSPQDIELTDKLYHALKSMKTYQAMKDAEGYEEEQGSFSEEGNSGYRGRAMNGRYVSRTGARMYPQSYDEGYAQGYSEAMHQQSGHIPMPYYYGERRW